MYVCEYIRTKIFAPKPESIDLIKLTTAFPQCKVNISHEDQDINGGLKVLGIPFGDDNFIKNCLKSRYKEYKNNIDKLFTTITKQQLFKILQYSSSLFQHLISVLPPHLTNDFAKLIDELNFETFRRAFLDNVVLQQTDINYLKTRARLPLRHNGLGMLALQERCEPAFFATTMAIKKAEHPYENNTWTMLNSNQT